MTFLRSVSLSAWVSRIVYMPLTEVKARGTVYEITSFLICYAVFSVFIAPLRANLATDLDLEFRCSAAWEDLSKLLLEGLLTRVSRAHIVYL